MSRQDSPKRHMVTTDSYSQAQEGLNEKEVESFLNSPPEQQEKHRRGVRSIWNLVQKSLKRLNSAIVIEDSEISLEVGDLTIEAVHRKEVLKILSEEIHLFI